MEFDIVLEKRDNAESFRRAVFQAKVNDAEIGLEGGVLQKVVHNHFGDDVFADFNHHTDALFVRFIANIGNAIDDLRADQIRDIGDHVGFVHLVGDFRHDDAALAVIHFLNVITGTNGDRSDAGLISIQDALTAKDDASAWEIWSR